MSIGETEPWPIRALEALGAPVAACLDWIAARFRGISFQTLGSPEVRVPVGPRSDPARRPVSRRRRFALEPIEPRRLMASGPSISGYVYADLNRDGVFETGETPLAGSTIQLQDARGIVGATTTDGNGAYSFGFDPRIPTTPSTLTRTVSFPVAPTVVSMAGAVPQFDPSLGTLTAVTISSTVTVGDQIQVESNDAQAANLTIAVTGVATLAGPGFSLPSSTVDSVGFAATSFDGVLDFAGTSGHTFGPRSQSVTATTTVTDPTALASYIGTGTVPLNERISASSAITGTANATQRIRTTGGDVVNVIYSYTRDNSLAPGPYTLTQTSQPPGGYTGRSSSIAVALASTDSTNNNFAETLEPLAISSLSGSVFIDSNNDGVRQANEAGLPGVTVRLSGVDSIGRTVSRSQVTGLDGSYDFLHLVAGQYTITKTAPAGYFGGKNAAGTQGGTVADDNTIAGINLPAATNGGVNTFAELLPSRLSGSVYYDANNSGIRDATEYGIAHADLILTGIDDRGRAVDAVLSTAADGTYAFENLRPGTYQIAEDPASFFLDGKAHVGVQGGSSSTRLISGIPLAEGVDGISNDFGQLARPGCKLLGLTEYHTIPAHRLNPGQIGPKVRFALPTLVPAISTTGA